MKTKSVVSLASALLGFAALADSYQFTSGTAIVLNDSSVSGYVTSSGTINCNHTYTVDSTKAGSSITLSLNNATEGDYLLTMLGTADGYTATYTLTVEQGTAYSKTINVKQRNTNTNIGDTNKDTIDRQEAFLMLEDLPAGDLTLTLTINSTTGNWAGNYGYFTFTKVESVSDVAIDISSSPQSVAIGESSVRKPYATINNCSFEGNGVHTAIGSTKNGGWIELVAYFSANGTCSFNYESGTKRASTMSWTLTRADGSACYSGSDSIAAHGDWALVDNHAHDFGYLSAGYYVLKGVCSGSDSTYYGNFGNFSFEFSEYSDINITSDYTLPAGAKVFVTSISDGVTVDLNGNDLTVGKDCNFAGVVYFTNSVDTTLSTLTIDSPVNKNLVLGGNLRYVYTGAGGANGYFRSTADKINDVAVANTHTGGTVISNVTNQIRYFTPDNFGSGPIVMANASMMRPSSNLGDANFKNPWEFYGNNMMEVQNWANDTGAVNFKGPWSGDGFIRIQNGWVPTIELNGDMAEFTGTLEIAYKDKDSAGFWMRGDNTNGLPNATLRIANVGNDPTKHFTHLKIKPGNNATITHESNITAFPIGHLVTDGDNPEEFVNSYIMNCQQWASSTWEIGALNESGTFAGWFSQETANAHLAIKKVGTGTWTLTSSLHTFDGPLTVSAGRLNINSANLTNCAVVVKSGATLGGTGTLSEKCAVTVESGAVLAGSLTLSAGLTLESGAIFGCDTATTVSVPGDIDLSGTVVDGTSPFDGQVFLTVISVSGSVTGKPSVSAALAAVEKYNGKNGKWGVKSTTANGVTTYSLAWNPTAFMVIIR